MSEEIMANIQRSLGRIEQKVDTALAWQQTHVADDAAAFAAVRGDIQKLQLARATQAGKASVIAAVLMALSGTLGGWIATLFHRTH